MEIEKFCIGYCRQLDSSRMVAVFICDGQVEEVDCCFGNCIYQPGCTIAQEIEENIKNA